MAKEDNRTLAILVHVLGIFTSFIGPLIIFISTNDEYVKNHSRYALNWHFSSLVYDVILLMLLFGGMFMSMVNPVLALLILVPFILLLAISLLNLIFCIIAAVKASENKLWKYPLSMPFFKIR